MQVFHFLSFLPIFLVYIILDTVVINNCAQLIILHDPAVSGMLERLFLFFGRVACLGCGSVGSSSWMPSFVGGWACLVLFGCCLVLLSESLKNIKVETPV
ncbi:hypothetical protein ACS0TY_019298 [Phlomoides rotata]